MDEQRVRAAVERLAREAHGLFEPRTGEACRMVPVSVIVELVNAAATDETIELPR